MSVERLINPGQKTAFDVQTKTRRGGGGNKFQKNKKAKTNLKTKQKCPERNQHSKQEEKHGIWVWVENRGLNREGLWLPQGDARALPTSRTQHPASPPGTQGPRLGHEPPEKASSGQTNPDSEPASLDGPEPHSGHSTLEPRGRGLVPRSKSPCVTHREWVRPAQAGGCQHCCPDPQ